MTAAEIPDEPEAGRYACPDCGDDFSDKGPAAPMLLGLHRKRAHGISGSAGPHGRAPKSPRAPKAARPRSATGARGGRTASRRDLEDGTRELYESFGLLAAMRGDTEAAILIIGEARWNELLELGATSDGVAGAAGKAWAKVAQHNDRVEEGLSKLLATGDWSEVLTCHLPLLALVAKRRPEGVAKVAGGLKSRVTAWKVRKAATNGATAAKRRADIARLAEEKRAREQAGYGHESYQPAPGP